MGRGEPLVTLLAVLRQLQACHKAGLGATVEDLAAHCEVDVRTVRRKLAVLREAGIPVAEETGPDRRKRFKVDHALLPAAHVSFDALEAASLHVASGMLASMKGLFIADVARSALEKAASTVPVPFREELGAVVAAVRADLAAGGRYAEFGTRFKDLIDATSERWPVEVAYRGPGWTAAVLTLLEPYLIHCHAGTVYVVGRAPDREGLRTYALARIESVRLLDDETFDLDPTFDADRFVAEAFGGFHEGEIEEVVLSFDHEVAAVVAERVWHPSQEARRIEGGGLELIFRTAGPSGVLHWAKAFLPHVRIIEPEWLVRKQREDAQAWVERLRQ